MAANVGERTRERIRSQRGRDLSAGFVRGVRRGTRGAGRTVRAGSGQMWKTNPRRSAKSASTVVSFRRGVRVVGGNGAPDRPRPLGAGSGGRTDRATMRRDRPAIENGILGEDRAVTHPRPERSARSRRPPSPSLGLRRSALRGRLRPPSVPSTEPSNSRGARGARLALPLLRLPAAGRIEEAGMGS